MYFKLKSKKATEVKRSVIHERHEEISKSVCNLQGKIHDDESQEVTLKDIVSRSNFSALEAAVYRYTDASETSDMKSGLKISLYYQLKKLAKIMKGSFRWTPRLKKLIDFMIFFH